MLHFLIVYGYFVVGISHIVCIIGNNFHLLCVCKIFTNIAFHFCQF